jgi:MarR family transcriptional regulator, organic hydroperoxide resistance regulator
MFVRALQVRLAAHGVSFGHWTFLRILWEQDGLTQRELSEQAGVMEPSTFAAIKAMEELGYVSRRQTPHNRKNVYVFLTPKGRALRAKLVPLAEEINRIAVRGIAPADIGTTRRALVAMIENLTRPWPPIPSPPRRSAGPRRGLSRRTPARSSPPRRSRAA